MDTNRRSLITGLVSFVAAPAIVRASSLMKVKLVKYPIEDGLEEFRWWDEGINDSAIKKWVMTTTKYYADHLEYTGRHYDYS